MKKDHILLIGALVFLLMSCSSNDPNEPNIPDGKDFKDFNVEAQNTGQNLIVDINFYADFDLDEFFFYFDHDNDGDTDYLIKCRRGEFIILKESDSSPGLFDNLKYSGTPTINGDNYHLVFPWEALDLVPDFTTYYWFFAIESGDRMPNSGSKQLAVIF